MFLKLLLFCFIRDVHQIRIDHHNMFLFMFSMPDGWPIFLIVMGGFKSSTNSLFDILLVRCNM